MNKFEHIIDEDGVERYFKDGKYHREDGPAIKYPNGTGDWYLNGELHRVDGPAVKWSDGSEFWYLNGKPHRVDGPAMKWANGTEKYYLNDVEYSKEEFNRIQGNKKYDTITINGEEFYLVPVK